MGFARGLAPSAARSIPACATMFATGDERNKLLISACHFHSLHMNIFHIPLYTHFPCILGSGLCQRSVEQRASIPSAEALEEGRGYGTHMNALCVVSIRPSSLI